MSARARRLQRRYEKQDAAARENGLRLLLSTADGRRFAWLFLADCGVFRNPFNGNALNTAFAAGELNIGQRLLAEITETAPEQFLLMQKENLDAERSRRDAANAAIDGGDDTDGANADD